MLVLKVYVLKLYSYKELREHIEKNTFPQVINKLWITCEILLLVMLR